MTLYMPHSFVVSGPSKAGKTSLVDLLCQENLLFRRVITATTRKPRERKDGSVEEEGIDYYFFKKHAFNRKRFIEKAKVHNNWYGTPATSLNEILLNQKHALWILDVQGADKVHEKYNHEFFYSRTKPRARMSYIFFLPEYQDFEQRLSAGSDKNKEERLESAIMETGYLKENLYDYVVDTSHKDIGKSLLELKAIIWNEFMEQAKDEPELLAKYGKEIRNDSDYKYFPIITEKRLWSPVRQELFDTEDWVEGKFYLDKF